MIFVILSFSFTISFLIRSINGFYGWELNEFDPFFNYRATQFLLENGLSSYFSWNDDLSWYPYGRDVSETSQVFLHLFTAITYSLFNFGLTLYDYVIILPVIIGSLTSIVIFALIRVISNTTAGLFGSLLFSISLPIIVRGSSGWFKSEPLGIFFGIFAIYLLLSGLNSKNFKSIIFKLILSSLFLIFALSSWGGSQFFILITGIFLISLPFIQQNKKSLIWKIPLITISCMIFGLIFERTSVSFVSNASGIFLVLSTILSLIITIISVKYPKNYVRNGILIISILFFIILSSLIIFPQIGLFENVSYRYLNAINPYLTTSDPLIDSISEHATNNIKTSFFFNTILMIFGGLGTWIILSKHNYKNINPQLISFPLIFGMFGVYISSAFLRLELLSSIGLIILSSISLSFIINSKIYNSNSLTKYLRFSFIFVLLIIPLMPFTINNSFSAINVPSTILNGGTYYAIATDDWKSTLNWINENTPEDSIVASWWDYGYWIQTLGNRATLSDNSTLIDSAIKKTAKILFMNQNDAWSKLQENGADYFIIFVAGQRLLNDNQFGEALYTLGGGGDESKKIWFSKIAGLDESKYFHSDQLSGTNEFWNNTILGKMIPFELIGYVDFETQEQSYTYKPGMTGIYRSVDKFDSNDPFKLVYASPSFYANPGEPIIGVFIYEINDNFINED